MSKFGWSVDLLSIVGRKPPRKRRPGPARRGRTLNPQYLNWIRTLDCCVPSCTSKNLHKWDPAASTEAAHVGERGLSQKCDDTEAIPLCTWHHTAGPEAHHKLGKRFWKHHGLDRDELIRTYQDNYALECASFSTEF